MNKFTKLLSLLYLFIGVQNALAQTQITFYTSMGNFITQLDEKKTPITSANFIKLVNEKFYDTIIFHRVVKSFVIQGGDPTGTGNGGCGYTIADEYDSLSNLIRTIGMANDGLPHTAGSQFYFNLVNNVFLDHKYTVFGKVVSNFVVVQNIGKVAVNGADRPLVDVVMDSVRVTPFVGISTEALPNSNLHIAPNPITINSNILFFAHRSDIAEIKIFNQIGNCIISKQMSIQAGKNRIAFNAVSELQLAPGIYYFTIAEQENIATQKFIVLK